MAYSSRIVEAFRLAHELHQDQVRKGARAPYITHLAGVASVVGEYGGREDQFIAALLHDAVEDQGGVETLDIIRARFGDSVAEFVKGCSDSDTAVKPAWHERKSRFIQHAAHAAPDLKLIIAADKLHNVRATTSDLYECGNNIWTRFNGGRDGTLWYYAEMVRALSTGWPHPLMRELTRAVDTLQRKAIENPAPPSPANRVG